MQTTNALNQLLDQWKSQRATRVNFAISRFTFWFLLVVTVIDFSIGTSALIISGDVALVLGSLFTYLATKDGKYRPWAWIPLYFSLCYSIHTSLFDSGGIDSPFLGGYLALLFVAGLVIQIQVRALYLILFVFFNFIFWFFAEIYWGRSFGEPPPVLINLFVNVVVIAGLMVCIYEFLRTEKHLAREVLKRYRELEKAQESLQKEEAANSTKSTFLANISHELRTPLGAILGYADLALDPAAQESERKDFLTTIKNNGTQLLNLVNDLLDLTKAEAGKVDIESILFNPSATIDEVISLFSLSAQKKGLSLEVRFESQKPTSMISDPLRFRQILNNILSNAVKFSDHGTILVSIKYPIPADSKNSMIIEIQDSGPGLSIEEQSRLFKPFSQADASVSRKYGGTGLGLNLSRHLARLLGGDLYLAWTQPGVGSRFALRLPGVVAEEKEASQNLPLQSKGRLQDIKLTDKLILLVEDNPDNQVLISKYLKATGAEVELASDGLEGVNKGTAKDYDLVLMDVQMPIMDGLQAVTLLRQKRFYKPVIALTAHAMKEDRDRCLSAGFDDYLTKPIDRNDLIQKMAHHLKLHS